MHHLHLSSLRVAVLADASFANNTDYSTQLVYIIMVYDDSSIAYPIYFSSYKCHHVVRSMLGGSCTPSKMRWTSRWYCDRIFRQTYPGMWWWSC